MKPIAGHRGTRLRTLALPALLLATVLLFVLHIAAGSKFLPPATLLDAMIARDKTAFDHMIIWELRLPRALIAISVGAALSVAGAVMQGVTRNPLADPGLLGLMAGASFAVVIASYTFGITAYSALPFIAAAGALGAALTVGLITLWIPGGATPLTLTLTGAVISAFLGALIAIMHLLDEGTFENLRIWLSGSLAGRDMDLFAITLPWIAAGLLAALALARQITALSMGDDVARGLGVRTGWLKLQLLLVVVVLTAGAVALAGPLGFIGLVIPHAVRLFVGSDYRWILPYAMLTGGAYLLIVDIVARTAIAPREISTGIITALIGAPIFVQLVRMKTK